MKRVFVADYSSCGGRRPSAFLALQAPTASVAALQQFTGQNAPQGVGWAAKPDTFARLPWASLRSAPTCSYGLLRERGVDNRRRADAPKALSAAWNTRYTSFAHWLRTLFFLSFVLPAAAQTAPASTPPVTSTPAVIEFASDGIAPGLAPAADWAVWARKNASGATEIVAARIDAHGRAVSPVVVSAGDAGIDASSLNPVRVATGSKGEVYVLWLRREPWALTPAGRGELRSARAADGQTFAAPVTVTAAEGADVSVNGAALAVTQDGTVIVAWLDERDAVARVKLPPEQRPKDVGYLDEDDPVVRVTVARSTDGGARFSFGVAVGVVAVKPAAAGTPPNQQSLVTLGDKASETTPLALIAGRDGALTLAWRAKRDELKGSYDAVRDVWTATSTDGGASWQSLAKIHNDRFKAGDCPGVAHGVARDAAGRVHAAWYNGSSTRPGVYYARAAAPGAAFSAPQALLSGETWVPYANAAIAVDGRERVWVAFEDRRDATVPKVVLLRLAADGSPVARHVWHGRAPALATDARGAMLLWQTGERLAAARVAD